ncbi:MAG: hypothetical protein ACKO0W_03605, partial [Planctomycetota bacterium]
PNAIFDIFNLTLTSAQNPTEIALLLGSSASNNAMVVATGMSQPQLAAVADNIGSVNLITGQIVITSALTSTQIAAIVSNAAPGATVTVDSNGMDAAQLAALYSTSILSLEVDETVARGEEFDVLVNMSGLPTSAIGMQARVVFDPALVEYVPSLSIGGTDFPTQVFASATATNVSFATGIDLTSGSNTGFTSGNVARLRFRAIAGFCDRTDVMRFATTGFNNMISSGGAVPAPVPFTALNVVNVTSHDNLALAGVPAADQSSLADAGYLGAAFTEPTVTASNNCEPSLPVDLLITYPSGSTGTTWPTRFPIGVSVVTWSSDDLGGNATSTSRLYTVENFQLATFDIDLDVAINPAISFVQAVRITLDSGDVVTANVSFTGNDGAPTDVQVPARTDYGCVAAKDITHTVSAVLPMSVSGTKYVADGTFELVSGDSNNDEMVDILDFAAFVADFGAGKTPASRSNYNRDAVVNNADFGTISVNFLASGESCSGGFAGGEPRTRVSVRDLRRMGLGELEIADINMDGWVDSIDIGLALEGHRHPNAPAVDDEVRLPSTGW